MRENTEELLTLKEKLTDLESKIKMQRDLYIPALANAHSITQELINEGAFDVAKAYIDFLKGKEKQEKPNHISVSPVGKKTIRQRNSVPDDIKAFLDKGKEENGAYIDYTGVTWATIGGKPISRKDIEYMAVIHPEDVRRLMSNADRAFQKAQEEKTMKKNNGAEFGPDTKRTKTSGIQEALNKAYSESEEVKGTNPVDRR